MLGLSTDSVRKSLQELGCLRNERRGGVLTFFGLLQRVFCFSLTWRQCTVLLEVVRCAKETLNKGWQF